MFRIEDNIIELTRGNEAVIGLKIDDYTFKNGDYIRFKVYKQDGLNEEPLLEKIVNITTSKEKVDIELTSEDTKIGEMINKQQIYWYEIELNDKQTVLGYDDEGAKILILYPEGKDKVNVNS